MKPAYLHGKFVWFEHASRDVERAMEFYDGLFGWRSQRIAMEGEAYPLIRNGAQEIGGYRLNPPGVPSQWMAYLSVPDVDASYRAAVAAGSTSLMPPQDFGAIGRACAIKDPTGATLCLWKGARSDPPDEKRVPAGGWFWNELWTSDERRALTFYRTLFGYQAEKMNMGGRAYHVLNKDGRPRAGLAQSVTPEARSMWLPYVSVADVEATASKAATLGAELLNPPTEAPGIGRYALVADPTGAAVAFIQPQGL